MNRVSVDKCSGDGCPCKARRPKPVLNIMIQNTIDGFGAHGYVLGGAPPAAGGAAMRMLAAREMDLVRMQRMQP